jgi:hypothetical protein
MPVNAMVPFGFPESLKIVDLLRRYNTGLPLDFVARSLGRDRSEVLAEIRPLEKRHVLRFIPETDLVMLYNR